MLLVTSVTAGEGKSTVASNLALALAKKHRAVMLIDADLRNPTQIRILGRKAMGKQGLERLLQEESPDANRIMEAAAYDEATNLVTIISEAPAATPPSCCPLRTWGGCCRFCGKPWIIL